MNTPQANSNLSILQARTDIRISKPFAGGISRFEKVSYLADANNDLLAVQSTADPSITALPINAVLGSYEVIRAGTQFEVKHEYRIGRYIGQLVL